MNNDIDIKRHSLAHLMAAAILELFPKASFGVGPTIQNGFYYDFILPEKITDADLPKIEKKIRELISKNLAFERKEIGLDEAKKIFGELNQQFKIELINDLEKYGTTEEDKIKEAVKKEKVEKATIYQTGKFVDLCRGPHIASTKEINPDSFKLEKIAGAYWRGDEKNPMLTRIYGLAFNNKKELDEYVKMIQEAERRDHRKLSQQLEIFIFDEDVGPGLPLWLPNGAIIIEELEKLAKETEAKAGYLRVKTPHIAKESMYKKSGHIPYYKDTMFPPMELEGEKYYLKAMNCPHHHKIYASKMRSYKDLPLRLAEYGTCYRYEKSGELFGLMRVRSLNMNDAHMYCAKEQFAEEFRAVNDMYLKYFKIFGIEKYVMRFSIHDPKKLGQKYVNEPQLWKETEDLVRNVLIKSKIPYVEIADEAAFYGPKIDVQVWSAIGREFTLATNQVDFAVPKRFGLVYTNKKGEEETPLCIHRAPLGTHERFIGFLIEHYAGAFPLWLAPIQAIVLPISEKHKKYGKEIYKTLLENDIRAEILDSNDTVSKKIREAEMQKVPYVLVVGDKEIKAKSVAVRQRGKGDIGAIKIKKFIDGVLDKIESKSLGL